jgi:PPOX class probable F420-dependent enzyme
VSALTDKQRAFLDEIRFGTLGTTGPGGAPHLTVMWYLRDGDEILFNTALGRRKPMNLERDPRVSLLVFDAYRFVRVSGHARVVATGAEALEDILRLAERYQGTGARERSRPHFSKDQRISYRFTIAHVYASADLK